MLNDQQVSRVFRLISRVSDFYFEDSRVYFSAGSIPNLLARLLPPLLTSDEPDKIIERWESVTESFFDELASSAALQSSFVTHEGRRHLLITETISASFVNSEWWNENCPRGIR